jgi:hypothetical protein
MSSFHRFRASWYFSSMTSISARTATFRSFASRLDERDLGPVVGAGRTSGEGKREIYFEKKTNTSQVLSTGLQKLY